MADIRWYDRFARVYDSASLSDRYYRAARERAIEQLDLSPGDRVFDIFCGTGVNLCPLQKELGDRGDIVGVDGSQSMLERAEKRARSARAPGTAIEFMRADLTSTAGIQALCEAIQERACTRFLFTLGLTCLPNWREFMEAFFAAAPPGSRFAVLDLYSKKLTFGARLINWIGSADCRRPVWEVLQEQADGFGIEWQRPFHVIDVTTFVAWGRKAPARAAEQ